MADQTNSTAATEEAIRNRMMLYFNIQDKENIAESIKSSSKAFKAAKSIIKKILSSSDTKPADNTFFIDLCSELVKRCGAPIVMMLENSDFCRYFLSYHTIKKSKEIPNLLELCVQSIPSGAQKDTIPHICSLYKKITKAEPVFSNKGTKTKFLELFESIHQIFNYQKNRVQNEDSKKALRMMIKTLFKESDFKNPIFNSLERHLLKDYKEQLKATLEAIEVERQKEKKKKLMKEIVSSNPENLLYEHQLRNRKSFIEGEKLPFEENQENEYKEYSFPFNDILEKTLARTICSFLNRSGGRIYIGVTDNKIIKGLKLFRSQRAELHQTIKRCISTFEPDILGKKLVKEYFLPVVDNDMKPIPGLFIVKIVVKQGDPSCLYSTTRDMLQCYLRYQDQSKLLSAKETKEFIIERHLNPAQKLPDTFEDPEPDPIVDIEDGNLNESGHSMISMSSENYTSASEKSHLSLTMSSNICSSFSQNSYVSMMSESAMQHSRENGIDHSLMQMEKDPASFSVSKSDTTKEESKATVDYGQNLLTGDDKALTPLGTEYRSNLHILDDSFLKDSKGDILDDDKSTKNKKYPNETSNQKKQEGDQLSFEGNPNSKENSMLNSNSRSKNKKSAKAGSESKKASTKEGQKEYYSHLLNEFNNIQINGKNAVKVYEIFIDGLPITWTQDQFDKFVEGLKFKSIFSSRMFKKDTGLSNGRAFVNFTEREEAQKFVDLYHDSTEFGKALIAKFKEGS